MKYLFLICLLSLPKLSYAQRKDLYHSTCQIYLNTSKNTDFKKLYDTVFERLRLNGFFPEEKDFAKERFQKDTMYLTLSKDLEGKGIYPPCKITIDIKQMKENRPSANDTTIFHYISRRAFPRVTREGISRCNLATRDAFAFSPICSKKIPQKDQL